MLKTSFNAKDARVPFLQEGTHLATITETAITAEKAGKDYVREPQYEIKYSSNGKVIKVWHNASAYLKYDDLTEEAKASGRYEPRNEFAVDITTGKRIHIEATGSSVESEQNGTDKCNSIIASIGKSAGFSDEFNLSDLVGKEVGIVVKKNEQGQLRVAYT